MSLNEIEEAGRSIERKAKKLRAELDHIGRPDNTKAHLDEILSDTRSYKEALDGVKAEAARRRENFLDARIKEAKGRLRCEKISD